LRESHRDNSQIPTVALRPACRSNFAARLGIIYDAPTKRRYGKTSLQSPRDAKVSECCIDATLI
jgi:hypothetical protein